MIKDLSKYIIITDMDGTFLPSSKKISDTDKNAIRRFQQAGGKFTIATGRALQATEHFFDDIDFNFPVVLYNGAVIYDVKEKKALWTASLPIENTLDMANDVFERFSDTGGEVLRLESIYVPRMNDYERAHMKLAGVEEVTEMSIEDIPTPWLKVLFANTPERITEIEEYIGSKSWDTVDFVRSAHTFYEMLPKNITKGSALAKLRGILKLEGYTIIAVGDYNNDIEMIKEADIGYAPSNAQPEVKEIADIVLSQSCEENVISAIIDALFAN